MRPTVFLAFLAISVALGGRPAGAADDLRAATWRAPAAAPLLPFPRSERAVRVWNSRACWSTCQMACTADQAACLKTAAMPQRHCVAATDACDRACQRDCRSGAGPLLAID